MSSILGAGKELAKTLARVILGEYSAYYVYVSPQESAGSPSGEARSGRVIRRVSLGEVESCPAPAIREQAFYFGAETLAYASYLNEQIAGLCIYWYGARYRTRNFWPLKDKEAKLVEVITAPGHRGLGIATELIRLSCTDVLANGFDRAYARIWHSNTPSLGAFERAGWTRRALVIEINPLRLSQPIRLRFRTR